MCVFAVTMPHLYQTFFLICVTNSHCRSINHSVTHSSCQQIVHFMWIFFSSITDIGKFVIWCCTWNFEHAHTSHHYFEISKSGSQTNTVFECTRRPLTIQFTVHQGLQADLIWCMFPANTGWLKCFESVKLVLIYNLNKISPDFITEKFTFVLNPHILNSTV